MNNFLPLFILASSFHVSWQILSFETEPRLTQLAENGESFTNYLLLRDVNANDSGKYTCAPQIDASGTSSVEPASIMVHVVNGTYEGSPNATTLFSLWSAPLECDSNGVFAWKKVVYSLKVLCEIFYDAFHIYNIFSTPNLHLWALKMNNFFVFLFTSLVFFWTGENPEAYSSSTMLASCWTSTCSLSFSIIILFSFIKDYLSLSFVNIVRWRIY